MYTPSSKQQAALKKLKKLDSDIHVKWDQKTGVPLRVKGGLSQAKSGKPERVALDFLIKNRDLFVLSSPDEEMRYKSYRTDQRGNTHVKFQQTFEGLPVFGRELIVHLDQAGAVRGTNGRLTPDIKLPTKPTISAKKAIKAALKNNEQNRPDPIRPEATLLVYIDQEGVAHLAWQLTLLGKDTALDGSETPARWEYFVDAQSGKIIWRYNNEQTHTATTGSGVGKYAGAISFNTMHDHGAATYKLEDSDTGATARVFTHDADGGYPPADVSEDNNNNWNAVDQGQEVDCHFYTRIVFDYYLSVHGRDSYDDAGADMHIYAHCGSSWNNASWNGSYVKVGDGDGVDKDSYCALDVIAHEWPHAVTEHTAGLVYSYQPGALNESMSDVFAALIDGDWLHGEDYWLKATAPSSRNLEDPTNGGQYDPANPIDSVIDGHQPDHMDDIYSGASDYGGVHINSGIMNKAAYLITTGGSHRGITICEGLGRDLLGELYYHALTNYLTSSSEFDDMRDAVLDSLDDLYLTDARYDRWRASIINAFAAVGIGDAVTCPITCWVAPRRCPPAPDIHVFCPPSPRFICPPSPRLVCPPSPHYVICPPSPHACLPGPDPLPFNPEIVYRSPELDIVKISGIGEERAALLKAQNILTVKDYLESTKTSKALKSLSKTVGISEKLLKNWRVKAEQLSG